ncbi:MAG: hypothetical protein M3332_16030 [Actinomycetota bacterium]|nr:hypothetical protein [Actinomycetota bacterium]
MPTRSAGLLIAERVVCVACRVGLPGTLSYGPVPRRSIHGNGGPSSTVFVGEVDQQCVAVVLDAQAMPWIRLLLQTPDNLSVDAGDMLLQALVTCAGVTLRAVPTRRRSGCTGDHPLHRATGANNLPGEIAGYGPIPRHRGPRSGRRRHLAAHPHRP